MSRLAEYISIIGVKDFTELYHGKGLTGTVIQRFPQKDRKDDPFPQALELFSQPGGWAATVVHKPPSFYIAVLTDIEGRHSYCACLSFHEPVTIKRRKQSDLIQNESQDAPAISVESDSDAGSMTYYVPKCLCLISKQNQFETLKTCLMTMYITFLKDDITLLQRMIGCALGFVNVPPPGGPQLTFSLGGGDSLVIHPPLSDSVPVTRDSVAIVFNQLGIHNMLEVFTALVTENKLLLLSTSYTHLTLTAQALTALMYPLKFSYVYIPVLPISLLDFLSAPTPFLMGVHVSYSRQLPDMFDVVLVHIDEGYVTVPDNVNLPIIPEPFYSRMMSSLKLILTPSLLSADLLFQPTPAPSNLVLQDKELRAVFIQFFAEIVCGYRSCLTFIRIHPKPVISFNKISFLEKRGLVGDDFLNKVLDSVSFSTFTQARGPPFRECDLFDELVASVPSNLNLEDTPVDSIMQKIHEIARILYENEPDLQHTQDETSLAIIRGGNIEAHKTFPLLDATEVENYIGQGKDNNLREAYKALKATTQRVPIGRQAYHTHYINQRRLEVIKECVAYIFENKISEARKILPSVLRALKSKGAQLSLCHELSVKVKQNRFMLDHDQFNLVIRLMNAALQDDSSLNTTSVAAALLPLACAFCRKLGPGVSQFAYTCIQEHPIWGSLQFWEEAYYAEAQSQIVDLHAKDRLQVKSPFGDVIDIDKLELKKTHSDGEAMRRLSPEPLKKAARNSMLINPVTPTQPRSRSNSRSEEKLSLRETNDKSVFSAMDLAAELLSEWSHRSKEEQSRLVSSEESIVYSLAMLFANRMISMRVPLNACVEMKRYEEKRRRALERANRAQQQAAQGDDTISNVDGSDAMSFRTDATSRQQSLLLESASNYPGSVRDGSSSVADSLHDLTDTLDLGDSIADNIAKFILRFVDRVCLEADITADHLKSLQGLVPGLVSMHIDTLAEVYRETKSLAPTQKAKIMKPSLLPGEILQFDGLRCFMVPDGRDLGVRSVGEMPMASDRTEEDRDVNFGSDIGGPCLLPAEGAVFLTNYRVIFKGTPVDQFASEMIVCRAFPVGSLVKEKRVSGHHQILPNCVVQECLQLRSSTFQMLKLCFDQEVSGDRIENFRRYLQKLRWPQTVYSFFSFHKKETKVTLQRTLSQRQHSVRKSHKSLTTVAALAKKKVATTTRNSLRKHKYSVTEENGRKRVDSANHVSDKSTSPRPSIDEDSLDGFVTLDDEDVSLRGVHRGPDRLSETPLCKDYERVGLGGVVRLVQGSTWRISMVNYHYAVCRSYPAVVVVPAKVSDDSILKVAKNHRLNRFPVAVWRHRKTKGVLLRAGGISKGVMTAVLRTGLGGAGSQGLHSASVSEDEKFFAEIVNTTALVRQKGKAQSISIGAALSLSAVNEDLSSVVDGHNDISKGNDEEVHTSSWEPANLYVFSDKALPKGARTEVANKCTYIPIEHIHDASHIKTSFTKLLKTCCPSLRKSNAGANTPSGSEFFCQLEESKWLQQLSLILQIASTVVNLIEIQGSSCLVCFGDGTEVTTQVISLAQIMLDPYYRTIDGFRVLIEKEWLAFGYRFSNRGNQNASVQSGVVPFFLQFLDGVYQIMEQFPHAFEFNGFFLSFLAYHHVSMRFSTFMLDSEHERVQHGWLQGGESLERTASVIANSKTTQRNSNVPAADQKTQSPRSTGQSIWDYIKQQGERLTLFQSFRYHSSFKGVLQPFCNVSNLSLWDFYTSENLYTGPPFDIELIAELDAANPTSQIVDPEPSLDLKEDISRCLSGCYGDINQFACDEVSYLLSEIYRLREELDQKPQPWREIWESLDVKPQLRQIQRQVEWHTIWAKERRLALHKRATMEMVLVGKSDEMKNQVRKETGFEHPHNFHYHNYLAQSICDYCLRSIWGLGSGLQCSECGYNVHEKCKSLAPAQCPKHGTIQEQQASNMSTSTHSVPGSEHSSKQAQNPRSYRGKLFKRGQMLRQWKARWFVLDAQKNQMRYYDSEEDKQLQGYIDLGDLQSCVVTGPPPGGPKWADPKSFFELRTARRYYYLLAPDRDSALEWVDRLTALIG